MELFYQISIFVLFLFGGIYSLLIILFTIGWFQLKGVKKTDFKAKVSVILPARNEAENIGALLNDLKNQSISKDEFEALIIDDHSDDNTRSVVLDFIGKNPQLGVQLLESKNYGKKEAIKFGIDKAKGDIILSIDADCRVGDQWIENMRNPFARPNIMMVSGPVTFFKEKSIFDKIQSLDFLSLVASGAGAIGIKLPFICNGANLAFRKSAFTDVNGFEGNSQLASGDDVFLLHKIKKEYGSSSILFLKEKNAIVETAPVQNLKTLLQQRKRWASKSKAYKDFFTLFTAMAVAGYSFMLIVFLILSVIITQFLPYFLIALGVKIIIDFTLLMSASSFFKRKYLLWIYFPMQLIYPLYTAMLTVLALFTKNEWKGRGIN